MADERSKDTPEDAVPEGEVTPEAPASPKPPDLRVSSHQDLGVKVSRDLNAGGWLARGDRSNMSKLSFSVRAKRRDELDPELAALRDPAPRAARPIDPAPPASPPSPVSAADADVDAKPAATDGGVLGRLGRLFRSE